MIQYPLRFQVSATSPSGIPSPWTATAGGRPALSLAIPKEFGGPDSGFSPEDLFALAAANCFIATFKVVAERSRLEFRELQVEALLTVDRGPDGAPWMSDLLLRVRLEGASDQERGLRLLEKTSKSCLVLNSLKTRVEFSFEASA